MKAIFEMGAKYGIPDKCKGKTDAEMQCTLVVKGVIGQGGF